MIRLFFIIIILMMLRFSDRFTRNSNNFAFK